MYPPHCYHLTWMGKMEAAAAASTPSPISLHLSETLLTDPAPTASGFVILSDNLPAMQSLLPTFEEKVSLICIDPPYNTTSRFSYRDDFRISIKEYRESNPGWQEGDPFCNGRLHQEWLNLIYPRLLLAHRFLREDGVLYCFLDDVEIHNLRCLLDEIFGADNFVASIIWQRKHTRANDARWFSTNHDYILVYAKNKKQWRPGRLPRTDVANARYKNPDNDPRGPWMSAPLHAKSGTVRVNSENFRYTFKNGYTWCPPKGKYARLTQETMRQKEEENRFYFGKDGTAQPSEKKYLSEVQDGMVPTTIWLHTEVGHNHIANEELASRLDKGIFETAKPTKILKQILELSLPSTGEVIVMDFFAGSGSFGDAVVQFSTEKTQPISFLLIQEDLTYSTPRVLPDGTELRSMGEMIWERMRRAVKQISPKRFCLLRYQSHPDD